MLLLLVTFLFDLCIEHLVEGASEHRQCHGNNNTFQSWTIGCYAVAAIKIAIITCRIRWVDSAIFLRAAKHTDHIRT